MRNGRCHSLVLRAGEHWTHVYPVLPARSFSCLHRLLADSNVGYTYKTNQGLLRLRATYNTHTTTNVFELLRLMGVLSLLQDFYNMQSQHLPHLWFSIHLFPFEVCERLESSCSTSSKIFTTEIWRSYATSNC